MTARQNRIFCLVAFCFLNFALTAQAAPPGNASDWTLTFSDEFNGSSVNTANWTISEGAGSLGYGGLLQYFSPNNVTVANGLLTITSKIESMGGMAYTSGAVNSDGKQTYLAGYYLEVRARLPVGRGMWPAIWSNGTALAPPNNSFAELDLMERWGPDPTFIAITHHTWTRLQVAPWWIDTGNIQCYYFGPDFSADFHTFAVDAQQGSVIFYVDGVQRCASGASIPDRPLSIRLNTSIGLPFESPDGTTVFPQNFDIDYVRLYEKTGSTPGDTAPPTAPTGLTVQ